MVDARDAAFTQVFRTEYAVVVAYCQNRVNDAELARDLAGETFRALWCRWEEPRRSDRAWLLGVAHNLVIDEYRRRSRRDGALLGSGDGHEPVDPRSGAGFEHADVRRALASLRVEEQEVLRLHYWDALPAREIAAVLGISVGAVWVRLSRARRAFAAAWSGPSASGDVVRSVGSS